MCGVGERLYIDFCENGTRKSVRKWQKRKFKKILYICLSIFLYCVIIEVQKKGGNLIAKEVNKMKVFEEVGNVFKDPKPAKKWGALTYFNVYCGEWKKVDSPEFPGTIKSEIWYEDKKGNLNIASEDWKNENWKKYILIQRTYSTRTRAYKAAKKIEKRMPKNYVLSFINILRVED